MYNKKFIIHNSTKHYQDWEIFEFILDCLKEGLLSNNNNEYCYCIVRQCEKWELVFVSNKTKTGYRFDVYENPRGLERKDK